MSSAAAVLFCHSFVTQIGRTAYSPWGLSLHPHTLTYDYTAICRGLSKNRRDDDGRGRSIPPAAGSHIIALGQQLLPINENVVVGAMGQT